MRIIRPISLSRAFSNGASIFFSPEGADKHEWRAIVFSYRPIPVIYRFSSWGFSVVGALILTFQKAMTEMCDAGFWWRTVGLGLCQQGVLSYMADVYTWGRRDLQAWLWKSLDSIFAAALTIFVGPVICYRMWLGSFVMDGDLQSAWVVGVMLALASKIMGARAARDKDASCERVLLWHCGWHVLPFLGVFVVALTVLRANSNESVEMAAQIGDF